MGSSQMVPISSGEIPCVLRFMGRVSFATRLLSRSINLTEEAKASGCQKWRGSYLAISVFGELLASRLDLRIDESGNQDPSEGLCLITVVLHDHAADIAAPIATCERIALLRQ